jgi:hypothetical protein
MLFCPSLVPWEKDTPVQVSRSRLRIHNGGAWPSCWASYARLSCTLHPDHEQFVEPKRQDKTEDRRYQE